MRRSLGAYLWDIVDAARGAAVCVHGVTEQEFSKDDLRLQAAARYLEIIGEAIHQAEQIYPGALKDLPGQREAVGMRNRLIHAYFDVDAEIVWRTIQDDLPLLERAVLQRMPEPPAAT